eukprot:11765158-Alexandrium_andersonii.AAC.1
MRRTSGEVGGRWGAGGSAGIEKGGRACRANATPKHQSACSSRTSPTEESLVVTMRPKASVKRSEPPC